MVWGEDTLHPEEPSGHRKLLSGFSKCGLQGPAEKASPGDLPQLDWTGILGSSRLTSLRTTGQAAEHSGCLGPKPSLWPRTVTQPP